MASNHTPATAITDSLAASFFWDNGYKTLYPNMTKKNFLMLAENGDLSISSVMENFISLNNKKLKRSNNDGEDHSDGSESKYMSTRIKTVKTKHKRTDGSIGVYETKFLNCSLSPKALKNKKGTLRIAISVYNALEKSGNVLMIRIPYPEWTKCLVANGYLIFDFYMNGDLKPKPQERFGKYICKTVKEFCA